jgi:hypothetical protein
LVQVLWQLWVGVRVGVGVAVDAKGNTATTLTPETGWNDAKEAFRNMLAAIKLLAFTYTFVLTSFKLPKMKESLLLQNPRCSLIQQSERCHPHL